jgi:hypothetical protein
MVISINFIAILNIGKLEITHQSDYREILRKSATYLKLTKSWLSKNKMSEDCLR